MRKILLCLLILGSIFAPVDNYNAQGDYQGFKWAIVLSSETDQISRKEPEECPSICNGCAYIDKPDFSKPLIIMCSKEKSCAEIYQTVYDACEWLAAVYEYVQMSDEPYLNQGQVKNVTQEFSDHLRANIPGIEFSTPDFILCIDGKVRILWPKNYTIENVCKDLLAPRD